MFWFAACRRYWWLLLVGTGFIGTLLLVRAPRRAWPSGLVVEQARPRAKASRRVPGVVSSPLGSEEHMVAMGDFDGDGRQDLAITDQDYAADTNPQGAATIWLGDGRGNLRRGRVLRDTDVVVLASLDAEGDGDTDLLAASPLLLWRHEGRGQLVPQPVPTPPDWEGIDDLATGDVDGDGDADLVLSCSWRLGVGLNDGQGHWHFREVPQKLATHTEPFRRVALADVDGDHDLDIVSPGERGILLFNDGRGGFGRQLRLPDCSSFSLAIGDLNGDARPDLVVDVSGINESKLGVYLNDGAGRFGALHLSQTLKQPRPHPPGWVALGDVDRDGDLDIVANHQDGTGVWVRLNRGRAQFEPAYQVPWGDSDIQELHLADIDHDGWLELLSPSVAGPPRRHQPLRAALTTLHSPTGQEYYEEVDQPPTATGGGAVQPVVEAAMQKRLVVPHGYSLNPAYPLYSLDFVVGKDGAVQHPKLGYGTISPGVDSALVDTLRQLRLVPGRLHGRPVRVALHLLPRLSGQGPPQPFPPVAPPGEAPIYAQVEQMPTFANGQAVLPLLREQALNHLILPDDEPLPSHSRLVVELVVDQDGDVRGYRTTERISPRVDDALTSTLGNLPRLVPGRHRGRPVRVVLRLIIAPTGADAPLRQAKAERLEAQTRRLGQARRHPGETDARFVRRVLPLSLAYGGAIVAHAWRPSAFGKQLFISRPGQDGNDYGTDLLVLDPYRPRTYALRVLPVTGLDDQTELKEIFWADVDHDGRPELLALKQCNLRGTLLTRHGRSTYSGSEPRYATDVFRLAGLDRTGRPRYQPDATERPYLDDLPTVAAVRRALARHRAASHKPRP